ncbi:MAG TPA: hypothetical protein VLT85_10075 [Terriglobales bacterium]|nr:hypothetical protein [Terriglobales bacterium]
MRKQILAIAALVWALCTPGVILAQGPSSLRSELPRRLPEPSTNLVLPVRQAPLELVPPSAAVRLAPPLALECYQRKLQAQAQYLAEYSAATTIRAELPQSFQQGEFELTRHYSAPNSLKFKAVKYSGDGFVKSNVITRLLQSEVDHVAKGESALTAISPDNYKFSYKGTEQVDGQPTYVYEVKPRQKRPGLFKGKIYLDVFTGGLRRAEGVIVKSPSFWVKKIEFVQEYADFGTFTFPVHMHSVASTRLIGQAVVDVTTRDYSSISLADLTYGLLNAPGPSPQGK